MAFFVGGRNSSDPQCLEWAKRFREILGRKHRMTAAFNARSWAQEFEYCRKCWTAEKVEKVLAWYLQHAGEDYVPRAFSARAFRIKFLSIEAAMQAQPDEESEPISPRCKVLAERLLNECQWPPEVAVKLPIIVQRTWEVWGKFCKRLEDVRRPLPNNCRHVFFLSHVLDNHSPTFVDNWMTLLYHKHKNMQHFTGPVLSLAFKPTSVMFKESFWQAWSLAWCGDATAFNDLLDELNKKE